MQVVPGTQEEFVPQMANYDLIGRRELQEGLLPGAGDRRRARSTAASSRSARSRVRSATALAPGDKVYSAAFGDQSAGTVANVAPSPEGGFEALVVAQLEAIGQNSLHSMSPTGPALDILPLPYSL